MKKDIFATNRLTLVNECLSIPDHEGVYIETIITAKCNPPVKRKYSYSLSNYTPKVSVQKMWNDFKDIRSHCMDLVLSKLSNTRFNQLWVNTRTKQLCRKKKI